MPHAHRPLAALVLAAALLPGAATPAALTAGTATGAAVVALASAPHADAVSADEIELADTAGVIDEARLRRDLAEVDFREPTRVAVYTERGADLGDLDDDRAAQEFNGRVLRHAREESPHWLSPDGQKWADGLMVYALDPENRIMGVYYGEDRKISTDQQADVREEATDAARDARWTDAAVDAVAASAELIGRPWHEDPAVWVGGGIAGLGAAAVGGAAAASRRSRRKRAAADLAEARRHLTSVVMDLDATEVNASTVPTGTRHGAALLERHRGFRRRVTEATADLDRLEAAPQRRRHSRAHLDEAAALRAELASLDSLDDAIGAANTLLNLHPGWPEAWDLQAAPLREDLAAVGELRGTVSDAAPVCASVDALESFAAEACARIEALGAELSERRTSPAAALDELDALRGRLTALLEQLAEAEIAAFTDDEEERDLMRRDLMTGRRGARPARGSILDAAHPMDLYWSITAFNAGHRAGARSVESHQQAQQGAPGTGYGSSGGSFSGAGSSGRF